MKNRLYRAGLVGIVCALLALAVTGPILAQQYQITNLGLPPDSTGCQAFGINANGQITGAGARAFMLSSGTFHDLGTLGGTFSYGYAINKSGQVVGYSETAAPASYRAFLYSGGTLINLGTLGGNFSDAVAINDSGQVVGYAQTTSPSVYDAFLYSNGTMTDLGSGPLSNLGSSASGINNSGQIVGVAYTQTGYNYAFLWTNGTFQNLGTLGGNLSEALAINDSGQVVGQSTTPYSAGNESSGDAFLWQNGTMIDINTLGSQESIAGAINSSGVVVGTANVAPILGDSDWHAFVYLHGQMLDLNDLIPANSGWALTAATGINDSGEIVGYGYLNGSSDFSAFLLTPQGNPHAPHHVTPVGSHLWIPLGL